jgi:hypothetical protein
MGGTREQKRGKSTSIMPILNTSRRAISILVSGFLARAGEGAGEGAKEVEV